MFDFILCLLGQRIQIDLERIDKINVKQDGIQTTFTGIQDGGYACNALFENSVIITKSDKKHYYWNICADIPCRIDFGERVSRLLNV